MGFSRRPTDLVAENMKIGGSVYWVKDTGQEIRPLELLSESKKVRCGAELEDGKRTRKLLIPFGTQVMISRKAITPGGADRSSGSTSEARAESTFPASSESSNVETSCGEVVRSHHMQETRAPSVSEVTSALATEEAEEVLGSLREVTENVTGLIAAREAISEYLAYRYTEGLMHLTVAISCNPKFSVLIGPLQRFAADQMKIDYKEMVAVIQKLSRRYER